MTAAVWFVFGCFVLNTLMNLLAAHPAERFGLEPVSLLAHTAHGPRPRADHQHKANADNHQRTINDLKIPHLGRLGATSWAASARISPGELSRRLADQEKQWTVLDLNQRPLACEAPRHQVESAPARAEASRSVHRSPSLHAPDGKQQGKQPLTWPRPDRPTSKSPVCRSSEN